MLIFSHIQNTALEELLKKCSEPRYKDITEIHQGKFLEWSSGCFLHQREDPDLKML